MACACKKENNEVKTAETKYATISMPTSDGKTVVKPTDQCIACTYKHYCEAWCQLTEYGYLNTNRRFVIGNLRAIVLHTFKEWKEIAKLARECSLLVEEVRDKEALDRMEMLGDMIEQTYYKVNPEAKARLEALKSSHINEVDRES